MWNSEYGSSSDEEASYNEPQNEKEIKELIVETKENLAEFDAKERAMDEKCVTPGV